MKLKKLPVFFNPKTIAVVGATENPGHVGTSLMENLIADKNGRIVIPVNPNREKVFGLLAYKSVTDIPESVDLVLIATPAPTVCGIVEECGKKGVAGVVIFSSGFKEAGKDGEDLYNRILSLSRQYQINILGPNCLGFLRPSIGLNASFAQSKVLPGKIAFISQSGALCSAILDWSLSENVGFSHFISLGEAADLGFAELIDYLGNDPETSSILIYMESLTRAKEFLSSARAYARTKPIVVLKTGKSLEGAKAALSHTGSLAGNDSVFDAAFKRVGILRVDTIAELFDCAKSLDMQEIPAGNRLAIVTNAGGPGVIATDFLMSKGGGIAQLADGTLKELNVILPPSWSHGNPVDVLGDADPIRFKKAIDLCLKDPGNDGVLVILTPQAMTDVKEIASGIVASHADNSKTLIASFMGSQKVKEGKLILEQGKIPVYDTPERAVGSFLNMYQYSKNQELLYETPSAIPHEFTPDYSAAKKILYDVFQSGRTLLSEYESKQVLSYYQLPVPKGYVVHSEKEAEEAFEKIGSSVILKIISPDIYHKTDAKGYILDVQSEADCGKSYKELVARIKKYNPEANISGVLVEKMCKKRYELFFGCKKDPIFGSTIVFGMGGVAVEIFNDINIALPPLNMALSRRLIEETKVYKLIKGFRNMAGVDMQNLEFLLYQFAFLIVDFPEIKEVDVNPFAIDETGGVILDAKIILDKEVMQKEVVPYSHLVISPYPEKYISQFEMKDKRMVTIRPIRPEDEPLEKEMLSKFSEETQRQRFFGLISQVTHQTLARYTQIDYDREIALIGELTEGNKKEMIGDVRIISDFDHDTAELALVVADPWQGLGLGDRLMDLILEVAKEKKIRKLYAYILEDNARMLEMFKKRGFSVVAKDGNLYAELVLK